HAEGAHRVVQSAGLAEERAAGRPLYGSTAPRLRRIAHPRGQRANNVANTNVLAWQGRVFGLVESSRPTELAPDTLATISDTDLGGVVLETFTAHPHFVAARRAIYGFGVRFGRAPELALYELPARGVARRLGEVPLEMNTVVHDFIATDHHLVFVIGPAAPRGARLPRGGVRAEARAARRVGGRPLLPVGAGARQRDRGRSDRRADPDHALPQRAVL